MSIEKSIQGLKVVLLGDAAAGKSSLLVRYTTGVFNDHLDSTIGAAFKSKVMTKGDKCVRLDIWDTAGQERYRSILPMYYRNAAAAVLVVDVTDKLSLKVAERWIMDIRQKTDGTDCFIFMAVNKIDLPNHALSELDISKFCNEKGISYVKTSALTGEGVDELFETIFVRFSIETHNEMKSDGVINCAESAAKPAKKCC